MNIQELVSEAESLPVEERARVVDALLRSLNSPESTIDKQWVNAAQCRLDDIRADRVATVSSEQVFANLRARLER
ncbi:MULTISPECIES: addiction module protein [unclassified Halomonas]|uniref:addiction module protein n=1 Tax=unclassified Halomonas TaxID=2609666 RepID=UPI001CF0F98B|nr:MULTISPECIES: addiction module protein [unclassified Halomonas]MCA8863331.1 addiction module protein [Halomonas sp. SBBP1]UZH08653.1 addiction module protein [Halomonas sp. BDJS001]